MLTKIEDLKYSDIIAFIIKKESKYPSFISKIQHKNRRKNLKKRFGKYCNNFLIDKKTNRLQRSLKITMVITLIKIFLLLI